MNLYHDPADLVENWVRGGEENHEPEMAHLSVRIPKEVMVGMDGLADQMGYSRSELVRELLASAYFRANERLMEYIENAETSNQEGIK